MSAVLATGMGILWWLGNLVRNKLVKSSHGNSLPARLLELRRIRSQPEVRLGRSLEEEVSTESGSERMVKGHALAGRTSPVGFAATLTRP